MSITFQSRDEIQKCFLSTDNTYPSHIHKQAELLYVLEGEIRVTIDQTCYLLKANDFLCIFPCQIHSTETPTQSKVLFLLILPEFLSSFQNHLTGFLPDSPLLLPKDRTVFSSEALSMLCGLIRTTDSFKTQTLTEWEKTEYIRSYLNIILANFFSIHSLYKVNTDSLDTLIQNTLFYIEENITCPLTLSTIADALHVSSFHLSHVFSASLHLSLPAYLNERRLLLSLPMLEKTDASVTEIAFSCGFQSLRTYYRVFQEHFHQSPLAYRKEFVVQETK